MTGEMVGYGGATAVPAGIFIRKELHFLHSGTTVGGAGGRIERHCTMSKGDLAQCQKVTFRSGLELMRLVRGMPFPIKEMSCGRIRESYKVSCSTPRIERERI